MTCDSLRKTKQRKTLKSSEENGKTGKSSFSLFCLNSCRQVLLPVTTPGEWRAVDVANAFRIEKEAANGKAGKHHSRCMLTKPDLSQLELSSASEPSLTTRSGKRSAFNKTLESHP